MRLADQQWLEQLRTLMHAHPRSASEVILGENTPFGEIVLGGSGDGRFRIDNLLFLADLGGDDIYGIEDNGFTRNHNSSSTSAATTATNRADPAVYAAASAVSPYSSIGTATTSTPLRCIARAARSRRWHVARPSWQRPLIAPTATPKGAALYGVGLLLDRRGDDRYAVRALGQGVGMPNGLGVLVDAAGDDAYVASGGTPTNYGTPGLTDGLGRKA